MPALFMRQTVLLSVRNIFCYFYPVNQNSKKKLFYVHVIKFFEYASTILRYNMVIWHMQLITGLQQLSSQAAIYRELIMIYGCGVAIRYMHSKCHLEVRTVSC